MVTLIILFIVLVLALIFLPFTKALMKDKQDLRDSPIEVRFKVLIDEINKAILDGKGKTVWRILLQLPLFFLIKLWYIYICG